MAGVRGTFAALKSLRARSAQLLTTAKLTELAQRMGAVGLKLIADEFRKSRDPYGRPWKPLRRERARNRKANARRRAAGKPTKRSKPLIDTGRLRASPTASVAPGGRISKALGIASVRLRISLPVSYASVHQNGGRVGKHTRRGSFRLRRDEKTNRFVKHSLRRKKGIREYEIKKMKVGGYKIPRRQILPERKTGGLGPIWGKAFTREAGRLVREVFAARLPVQKTKPGGGQ